jgi:hypothetical protein
MITLGLAEVDIIGDKLYSIYCLIGRMERES